MNNYYSILFAVTNPTIDEKIGVALLFTNGEDVLFDYSKKKLKIIKKLLPKPAFKLLKSNLLSIKKHFTKHDSEIVAEPNVVYQAKKLKLQYSYLQYLSRYCNNLLTFREPTSIELELTEENFKWLYEDKVYKKQKIKKNSFSSIKNSPQTSKSNSKEKQESNSKNSDSNIHSTLDSSNSENLQEKALKIISLKKEDQKKPHLKHEIDKIVFKLYDLTYEEVLFIEPNFEKVMTEAEYEKLFKS